MPTQRADGLNFLIAGVNGSDGNVLLDPSVVLENARVHADGPVVGYARSLRIGKMSSKIDVGSRTRASMAARITRATRRRNVAAGATRARAGR